MTLSTEFCTSCGSKVDDNDLFCPSCGAPVSGREADQAYQEMYKAATYRSVTWAGILLLIAAIPSIIMGAYMIIDDVAAAEIIKSTYDWVTIDASELANLIMDYGIIMLAIGLLGVVGAVLCFVHKYWWAVLLITVVVLCMGVATFIGIFLGFLALWSVLSSRSGFEEYQN